MQAQSQAFEKLKTGIPGFDHIAHGGLPRGRTSLISGTAGSAKTVFATQFLVSGILNANEPGVFVTFEEPADEIRNNMRGFNWDIEKWEKEGKWAFVDASPQPGDMPIISGSYDLSALLARIEYAVKKVNAKRVSIDSLGGIFSQLIDGTIIRNEFFRILSALKKIGVTSIITAERSEEYGPVSRYGVEEFVTDNVIILRNVLEQEQRRRTIEILKFRGTFHQKGEYPFTVLSEQGLVVIPLSAMELQQHSSTTRITSGIAELDKMCGGGFFRDSIVFVSGPTGTGKTLVTMQFVAEAAKRKEKSLLFAFEESREQLFRNASGWGLNLEKLEKDGLLKVICRYPESSPLEDHLIFMRDEIEMFKPQRVAIDSVSALERNVPSKMFREFIVGFTSHLKDKQVAGLLTATSTSLLGGTSITDAHISTITDTVILLRYVELYGEMRRGITVLKMSGSRHEKEIREFIITEKGMQIRKPFRNISGILSGHFQQMLPSEMDRMDELFKDDK